MLFVFGCNDENEAPSCTISNPTENETYTIGDTIRIMSEATDEDGTIKEIKLAINDEGVTFFTKSTLDYNWDTGNEVAGNYKISIIAIDDDNYETLKEVNINLVRGAELPRISIDSIRNKTSNSVSVFCHVNNMGYPEVSEVGVCWVTDGTPSIDDNNIIVAFTSSPLQIDIEGLETNTDYQVCAFARNSEGLTYGGICGFAPYDPNPENEIGNITDTRDGQVYNTVKIANKWWLAQNLNYYTNSSVYFDNDSIAYNALGRLYTYEDALNSCPNGWHLASDEEWISLEIAIGILEEDAYTTGYRGEGFVEKLLIGGESHFEAELGGLEYQGSFGDMGLGHWWTSTEKDAENIWFRCISESLGEIERSGYPAEYRFSVRCVKDE